MAANVIIFGKKYPQSPYLAKSLRFNPNRWVNHTSALHRMSDSELSCTRSIAQEAFVHYIQHAYNEFEVQHYVYFRDLLDQSQLEQRARMKQRFHAIFYNNPRMA
ncbi:MAG: hypothetical protein AB7L09_26975 [Nitrospira sp.]